MCSMDSRDGVGAAWMLEIEYLTTWTLGVEEYELHEHWRWSFCSMDSRDGV